MHYKKTPCIHAPCICTKHHTGGGSSKKSGPRLVNSTSPLPRGMTDYYPSHYTSPCLWFQSILYILYYIATFRLHKVSWIPFYMTAYYMVTLHSIPLYMAGCDYMWFIPHALPISLQINSWWKSLGRARQLFRTTWPPSRTSLSIMWLYQWTISMISKTNWPFSMRCIL